MPLYMNIPHIPGDVHTKGFQNTIEIHGIQHSSTRSVAHHPGLGVARDLGGISMTHVQIAKQQDPASALLFHFFCSARMIATLDIYHCIRQKERFDWLYKLTLSNVLIAKIEEVFSPMGGTELLHLSYSALEKGYKSLSDNGQLERPAYSGFNLDTASIS